MAQTSDSPSKNTVVKDTMFKVVNQIHETLFTVSKGKVGGNLARMPVLRLTTTGAKSGKERTSMLTSPYRDGDAIAIVASKGGDPRHPAWFHNLKVNPQVKVLMDGVESTRTARILDGAERAKVWTELTAKYKNYADYQTKTDRTIPVVMLEN